MYAMRNVREDGLLYRDVIRRMPVLATAITLGTDYKVQKYMLLVTRVGTSLFASVVRGPRGIACVHIIILTRMPA